MTEAIAVDPIFETDFVKEMARQMRALDSYGTYEGWTAKSSRPLCGDQGRNANIPVIGDPDDEIISRIKAYYNAIAVLIEKECGLLAVPMIITHEGFGRAIITVGKLVAVRRPCATSIATVTTACPR